MTLDADPVITAPPRTNLFELIVALLLGLGAVAGAWAGYQANQWGGTATEAYGKSSTTATRAATLYNYGITVANRDASLDLQAKQLTLSAMTSADPAVQVRDRMVAKYLYTQQLSDLGYRALGFPAQYHTKDKDLAASFPDELLESKGLETGALDERYLAAVTADGTARFAEAEKVFADGQRVSGVSTKFGLAGVVFTLTLFLGGMALVLKSNVRWAFVVVGYGSLAYGLVGLARLPWYG